MSLTTWTVGDVSSSATLTDDDHLYPSHVNELRVATNGLETLLDPDDQTLTLTNAGTDHGLFLTQSGVLAAGKFSLYVYSNAIQTVGALTRITSDNASSSATVMDVINDGTGNAIFSDINNSNGGFGLLIDSESSIAAALRVTGKYGFDCYQDLTGGFAGSFYRNIDAAGIAGENVLIAEEAHANNTSGVMRSINAGSGYALMLDNNANGISLHIDTEATSADSINIDAVNTSGIVVDINLAPGVASTAQGLTINNDASCSGVLVSLTNIGSGDILFLDQDGNAIGINIDIEATSADAINLDAVNTSGVVVDINLTPGAASVADIVTVDNIGANASTGNMVKLTNASTGASLYIDANGNTGATNGALYIENTGNTGGALYIYTNIAGTSASPLVSLVIDNVGFDQQAIYITNDGVAGAIYLWGTNNGSVNPILEIDKSGTGSGVCLNITNGGTGNAIFVDQNKDAYGFYIDKDCTVNDTRTWAAKVDSDNAGTGTALGCGIDLSSFSVDEPLLKVVADAITTAGAVAGQFAIDVGGTTYYVPYGATGT